MNMSNTEIAKFYQTIKEFIHREAKNMAKQNGNSLRVATVIGNKNSNTVYVNFPQEEDVVVEVANPAQIATYPTNEVYVNLLNDNLTSGKIDSRKSPVMKTDWDYDAARSSDPFIFVSTSYPAVDVNMTPEKLYLRGSRVILNITDTYLVEQEVYGLITDFAYDVSTVGSDITINLRLRIMQELTQGTDEATYNITGSDTIDSISIYKKGQEPVAFPLDQSYWRMYKEFVTTATLYALQTTWQEQDSDYRLIMPQYIEDGSDSVLWHVVYSGGLEAENHAGTGAYVSDVYLEVVNHTRVLKLFGTYAGSRNTGTTPSTKTYGYNYYKDTLATAPATNAGYSEYEIFTTYLRNWVGTDLDVSLKQGFFYIQPDVF